MDECDIASELEQNERDYSVQQILKNKPIERDIEKLLDKDLHCESCDDIIPIERQRIVLTLQHSCEYCIDCQTILEKESKLFGK